MFGALLRGLGGAGSSVGKSWRDYNSSVSRIVVKSAPRVLLSSPLHESEKTREGNGGNHEIRYIEALIQQYPRCFGCLSSASMRKCLPFLY